MLADKDVDGVVAACLGKVDGWFAASLQVPRGAAKERLTTALYQQGCHVAGEYDSVALALAAARQQAAPTDRIIVFGSFYTVAAAQQALNNEYATS
jgi:dihydrofolate synthase/folylpolyglutamate synthase